MSDALSVGYRMIDTAQAYANEEGVGAAIKKSGRSPLSGPISLAADCHAAVTSYVRYQPDRPIQSRHPALPRLPRTSMDNPPFPEPAARKMKCHSLLNK